mmetsp:Transcript_9071/g.22219  ORF Transcript_9071/g.22219 Transcript_9071/m.22219 type:complete len:228 (-) Transcript_9071:3132-3815(-)
MFCSEISSRTTAWQCGFSHRCPSDCSATVRETRRQVGSVHCVNWSRWRWCSCRSELRSTQNSLRGSEKSQLGHRITMFSEINLNSSFSPKYRCKGVVLPQAAHGISKESFCPRYRIIGSVISSTSWLEKPASSSAAPAPSAETWKRLASSPSASAIFPLSVPGMGVSSRISGGCSCVFTYHSLSISILFFSSFSSSMRNAHIPIVLASSGLMAPPSPASPASRLQIT